MSECTEGVYKSRTISVDNGNIQIMSGKEGIGKTEM